MLRTVKLSEVCSIKTGRKDVNEGSINGRYPFFTCAKEHTYSDLYSFDCEAILIAGNGAVGQTNYYKGKFEAYQRTYVLSEFRDILPKLLLLVLQEQLMKYLSSMALGNTIPYIKKKMLENFEITIPPVKEQQLILTKLEGVFSQINKSINLNNLSMKNSIKLKEKLISRIISNIDKKHFKKLEECCHLVRGPFGGSLTKSMFKEKGFAVYEQQHAINDQFTKIRYFIDKKKFEEMKRFELKPGDLIMSCSGATLGKVAIVPNKIPQGIINQALLKITPNHSILQNYLKIIMTSNYFQSILWDVSGGAAQPNVPSVRTIKDFLIPIVSIDEQKKIIKKIVFLEQSEINKIYLKKIEKLELLKQSILRDIFIKKNYVA